MNLRTTLDGFCDAQLNNAGCKWDGGDCSSFNEDYPNCDIGDHYGENPVGGK